MEKAGIEISENLALWIWTGVALTEGILAGFELVSACVLG